MAYKFKTPTSVNVTHVFFKEEIYKKIKQYNRFKQFFIDLLGIETPITYTYSYEAEIVIDKARKGRGWVSPVTRNATLKDTLGNIWRVIDIVGNTTFDTLTIRTGVVDHKIIDELKGTMRIVAVPYGEGQ